MQSYSFEYSIIRFVFQWREISKILEGVIRIGAINCQDEWMMCNEQGIQAYPTLRIYPKVRLNCIGKEIEQFSFGF